MKRNEILFYISVLGFLGISGLDILNIAAEIINNIYVKIGKTGLVVLLLYLYMKK